MQPHADGFVLHVRVQPGARREGIVRYGDGLRVAVCAPPEKGRANERVLELLSEALELKGAALQLLSGATSRDKRILVRGLTAEQLQDRLARVITR